MKRAVIIILSVICLCACNNHSLETQNNTENQIETTKEERVISMKIDGMIVPVIWEDNDSVKELKELSTNGLSISMSMYGGFEQVGPIGKNITSNDKQTTTSPGDIVLYSGNQLVVFYGSNSWSYTRLGKIDLSKDEIEKLLSNGDVVIDLEIE